MNPKINPAKCCLLLALISTICLQSCLQKMAFGNGNSWIPRNFDAKNTVFLIAYFGSNDKENRDAVNFMQKNYPYQYEMMEPDDTAKFPDKKKYRFMLLPVSQTIMTHSGAAGGTNTLAAPVSASDFYFYDRLTNTTYPPLHKGSYKALVTFKPVIETIVRHSKK
jgi:hypothetical protein